MKDKLLLLFIVISCLSYSLALLISVLTKGNKKIQRVIIISILLIGVIVFVYKCFN